ncbi:MAG: methyl-accepting chemotaxis protein [Spirochaetales bacterium]|nr:methyl-accepting chemotaxis protein [Spirochaetales bacterium]
MGKKLEKKQRQLWPAILGIYLIPVLANIGMRFYIDGARGVMTLLGNPVMYAYIGGFTLIMLVLCFRNSRFMKGYSPELTGEDLEKFQRTFVKYPTLPLAGAIIYSVLAGIVVAYARGNLKEYISEEILLCFSLEMLFGMPPYILFIRLYERQNSHIPFSEKHMSLSLKARFTLVVFLCMISLYGVSLIGTKFIILHHAEFGGGFGLYNQIRIKQSVIFLICVFMAVMNVIMLLDGILHRIGLSRDILNKMSLGDFSFEETNITSRDELGSLLFDLSKVRANVAGLIRSISGSSSRTVAIKEQLSAVSEQSSAAMTEMNGNIESIARSAQNLDNNMGDVSRSMDSLGEAVRNIDNAIDEQARLQQQSSSAVTEMSANIESIADIAHRRIESADKLNREAEEGRVVIEETIAGIQEIDSSIDNIKEITQVILGIASRTNLLAMNAAIEAAHAGEAGRGFSVVAEEIRKLAETSSSNSKQINDNIKDIIGKIEEAARRGSRTQSSFGSLTRGIDEVVNALGEIEGSVSELKEGSGEIIRAMDDLESNSRNLRDLSHQMNGERAEVTKALEGALQISSENQSAMGEMGIGAKEVMESSLSLNEQARRLSEATESLEKNVGSFKISGE